MSDRLARLLVEAASGRPPPSDGLVEVLASLGPDVDDVIVGFDGHLVVTTDVPEAEVRDRFPDGDFTAWCHPTAILWLADRAGREPGTPDIVVAARAEGGDPLVDLVEVEAGPDTRLRRSQVRSWTTADGSGRLSVGRGLAGRWELAYAVDADAQGAGRGRALVGTARHLVPHGDLLWAQTAPGNVRSVRALLGGGFTPVCGETLLLAPGPPGDDTSGPEREQPRA